MTEPKRLQVTCEVTAEGDIFTLAGGTSPNDYRMRVRDGWRDISRLPAEVLSERAIILEMFLDDLGWREIEALPYLRHLKEDTSNVPRMLPEAFRKAELRKQLGQRAEHEIISMVEGSFYW